MAIDIVARALAVSGKQNLENYYTKTESDGRYVKSSENFVKAFTIPNGVSTGTLAADVKQKLCNPDGHNYYVYDDTSEMILKYSFNSDDEIIQYKAAYLQNDKAYEITMQILPSNGSWRRSQTILNGATANPALTGTEAELTGLKVGGTNYKIPSGGLPTIKAGYGQFSEVFNYDAANANTATGSYAHAEGFNSVASDTASHAEGEGTIAMNYASHAEGKYNIKPMPNNLIHATGIGVSDSDRRDGFEVYKTGEVWCKGPLYVGGVNDAGKDIYKLDRKKAKEVATKEYVDNGFVKKVTGHNKVYATDSIGTDTSIHYSQSPFNSAITQYTSSGTLRTNTPTYELDAANKKYVDDAIGKVFSVTIYEAGD